MSEILLKERCKSSWTIFVVSFIIYAVVSMVKNVYGSSMVAMIGEGIFDKSLAGTINAGFYTFYGLAQIVFAKTVDRVSPIKLVYMTLFGILFSLVGMCLLHNFYAMLILWSFCGLIQFGIWPAILRVISEYVLEEQKYKAMTYISFSYCVGAFSNYLVAALMFKISTWEMLFVVGAVLIVICIIIWKAVTSRYKEYITSRINENKQTEPVLTEKIDNKGDISFINLLLKSGVMILLIASLGRTMLDMGLKSWVPTMIVESYGVSESFASILTTILIFVNLGGVFIANFMYPKYIKNVVTAFGMCFLISVPFTVLLLLTGRINVMFVVALLSIITTMMYAAFQFNYVIIPSKFERYNRVGSVVAIINGIASLGAAFANVFYGVLAENYGWIVTIASWIIIAVISFVATMLTAPLWKKFL